jgi:hypothetical protein
MVAGHVLTRDFLTQNERTLLNGVAEVLFLLRDDSGSLGSRGGRC